MKIIIFFILILTLNSCGGKAGSVNANQVLIKLSSFSTAQYNPLKYLIPMSYAAISSLIICPTKIRLKTATNIIDEDQSYDQIFALTPIDTNINTSGGTELGTFSINNVVATIIEIDLGTTCTSGKSIQFTNDSGSYSSTEIMKLRFTGSLDIRGDFTLSLDPQNQMDIINTWTNSSDILDLDTVVSALAGELP